MRYLTVEKIIFLHGKLIVQSGGRHGIRDRAALESAAAQPEMSFSGVDLYRTISDKATALGYSLIRNHAFVDGNKRIGHAAMTAFLILNGYEINASVDEQEQVILAVAGDTIDRETFALWVKAHAQGFGR